MYFIKGVARKDTIKTQTCLIAVSTQIKSTQQFVAVGGKLNKCTIMDWKCSKWKEKYRKQCAIDSANNVTCQYIDTHLEKKKYLGLEECLYILYWVESG